jgi:uncharacterized membrane protein YphA (DoxX/SURF4 family)
MKIFKKNKSIFFSFLLTFFSLPSLALAHVKWFAEEKETVRPYELTDLPVVLAIILSVIVVNIGIFLEKKLNTPKWFDRSLEKVAPFVLSLASIGFGLSFLIFSYYGFIFAPNLIPESLLGERLIWLQALAGAMIFLGIYERIGGLLLIVLFGFAIKEYGFLEMMDTLEMVGFAFYAMIVGRPKWQLIDTKSFTTLIHKVHSYGLPLLRVGTGLNLMILGFSEKILNPSLTANFLSSYNWNFMHTLGFEGFTDYWFAFSAGAAETLFGLFFLLGLVTRTTTIALAVFLVTTLYLLGPIELIGHLPHFSIAIVLLVLGAGARLRVGRKE